MGQAKSLYASWYDGERNKVTQAVRTAVRLRDNNICQLCKLPIGGAKWEIDHKLPLSLGGLSTEENLQLTHALCNKRKGNMGPKDWPNTRHEARIQGLALTLAAKPSMHDDERRTLGKIHKTFSYIGRA